MPLSAVMCAGQRVLEGFKLTSRDERGKGSIGSAAKRRGISPIRAYEVGHTESGCYRKRDTQT